MTVRAWLHRIEGPKGVEKVIGEAAKDFKIKLEAVVDLVGCNANEHGERMK
jgi:hypothetical protein